MYSSRGLENAKLIFMVIAILCLIQFPDTKLYCSYINVVLGGIENVLLDAFRPVTVEEWC